MKNIIIINGPNLNLLGNRETDIYGKMTLSEIEHICRKKAKNMNFNLKFHQTNNEGEIIELIQKANDNFDGLIINPAGFTHTSIAILDALRTISKPKIEIHLSNPHTREEYRRKSITAEAVDGVICGFGANSYILAIQALYSLLNE